MLDQKPLLHFRTAFRALVHVRHILCLKEDADAERSKLSRAANDVNRECGTANAIGGGSGELLGVWFIGHRFIRACFVGHGK